MTRLILKSKYCHYLFYCKDSLINEHVDFNIMDTKMINNMVLLKSDLCQDLGPVVRN